MTSKLLRAYEMDGQDYADDSMPDCTLCGSRPFINKEYVDGFYFGFSVGCPRYKINDGIYGADLKVVNIMRKHFGDRRVQMFDCMDTAGDSKIPLAISYKKSNSNHLFHIPNK